MKVLEQRESEQREYSNPQTAAFRATLDRLPDEIALAIGLRLTDDRAALFDGTTCLCGWAIREAIARETGADAGEVITDICTNRRCRERFGGSQTEWDDIYGGILRFTAQVEEALFDRVMAAATNSTRKPRSSQRIS